MLRKRRYWSIKTYLIWAALTTASLLLALTGCKTPIEPENKPPASSFSATPTSGTAPLDVSFTEQSTGEVTSWRWDFGDGASSELRNPSHQYQRLGSYTVSLRVSGTGGIDTHEKTNFINVERIQPPSAHFSVNRRSGDAPVVVTFSDRSNGVIDSWSWNFGDGTSSTVKNPTHTYQLPGAYTVSLRVAGPGGTDSEVMGDYMKIDQVIEFGPVKPKLLVGRRGPLWPTKINNGGDCDFKGNGPDVTVAAVLSTSFLGERSHRLLLTLSMTARERGPDFTTASGSREYTVYQTGRADLKIKKILSQDYAKYSYLDRDHSYDLNRKNSLGHFWVMGDTKGDDICNRTLDDTHVIFKNISFKIRIGPL